MNKNVAKKSWIVCLTLIIIIVFTLNVNNIANQNDIQRIAEEIQRIDAETIIYISSNKDVLVVEMKDFTEDSKKETIGNIELKIQELINKGMLQDCSRLIIRCKLRINEGYFLVDNVYLLPEMKQIPDEEKIYIDYMEQQNK